jgi:hypothetical protein
VKVCLAGVRQLNIIIKGDFSWGGYENAAESLATITYDVLQNSVLLFRRGLT